MGQRFSTVGLTAFLLVAACGSSGTPPAGCTASSECAAGKYCAAGTCTPKVSAGTPCVAGTGHTADDLCSSGICLGFNCCAALCASGETACAPTACDQTGACVFPGIGASCGPPESCLAGVHTPPSGCGGDGGCVTSMPVSCGSYTCDSAGHACNSSCTVGDNSPCAANNYCAAGACVPQLGPGAVCAADGACRSGFCKTHCCVAACGDDPTSNCKGACDDTGVCSVPTCNPGYGCGGGFNCKTSCNSPADCAPATAGFICSDPAGGACCLPVVPGATVYVDGLLGSKANCCDSPTSACLTVTQAMKLIAASSATGTTLSVSWNGASGVRADWAPAGGETYPVHLGLGVTLKAPGIFFAPPPAGFGQQIDVFDVYSYGGSDTARVTIEGDPAVDYVFIGFDSLQTNLLSTGSAVNAGVGSAVPLTLTKVWMNGQAEALNLGPGANVRLGPDPVIIGSGASTPNPFPGVSSGGSGITCQGSAAARATLQDDPAGTQVLQIDSQAEFHFGGGAMVLSDNCDVSLTQGPTFGPPPPCAASKLDGEGILLNGSSTLSLGHAAIQCLYNHGIDLGEAFSGGGSPSLALDSTLIQFTGQAGLKVAGGSVGPVKNSTVYHCRFGATLAFGATGSIDLSGGGNVVTCSTSTESGAFGQPTVPGINIWNQSADLGINAANLLWEVAPPALWSCSDDPSTNAVTTCTCVSGTCSGTDVVPPDQADAVSYSSSTAAPPIDQADAGAQTTFTCN
jgi:hypothetical protein